MRWRSRRRARRRVCGPRSRIQTTTRRSARRRAVPRAVPSRAPARCRISTIRNRASCRSSAIPPAPARAARVSSRPISAAASGPIGALRAGPERHAPASGSLLPPPLSLTAPGTSPTAVLLRSTAAGHVRAFHRHDRFGRSRAGQARGRDHARGRAAAQSAAAHSGRHRDGRHRRHREQHAADHRLDHAAAPAHRGGGRRVRAARPAHRRVPRAAVARSDRRLRHQSGARARRQGLVVRDRLARTDRALRLDAPRGDGGAARQLHRLRQDAGARPAGVRRQDHRAARRHAQHRADRRGHPDRRHRQSGQPERAGRPHALPDLHDARRHVRPDAALQPRRGHREGHGGAHRVSGIEIHRRHHRRAIPTATTIASAARCAPATT